MGVVGLPLPVSTSTTTTSSSSLGNHERRLSKQRRRLSAFLFSRARTTNLAVLLLASLTLWSLYLNLNYLIQSKTWKKIESIQFDQQTNFDIQRTHPISMTKIRNLNHLVIVPGHAIYNGSDPTKIDPYTSTEWILEPYQAKNPKKSIESFLKHIKTGIQITINDPNALLIYSGGQTRKTNNDHHGGGDQITESDSYYKLANQLNLHSNLNKLRITTERYSIDSLTNLLYSISRFKEYTNQYPKKISIVNHSLKFKRFKSLHLPSIKFPFENFKFISIDQFSNHNNEDQEEEEEKIAIKAELDVYNSFQLDLYGCHSNLYQKRKLRNPFNRFHPYLTSCPEISQLLGWCPSNGIDLFKGPLPWSP